MRAEHLARLDQGRRAAALGRELATRARLQAALALEKAGRGCPEPVRWRCYRAEGLELRVDVPHGPGRKEAWAWAYEGGAWRRVARRWAARLLRGAKKSGWSRK